jgi:hypothetical protein
MGQELAGFPFSFGGKKWPFRRAEHISALGEAGTCSVCSNLYSLHSLSVLTARGIIIKDFIDVIRC